MITYHKRFWGLQLLTRLYGSAFPRALPFALLSTAITLLLKLLVDPVDDDYKNHRFNGEDQWLLELWNHPYPYQAFAFIVGFIIIFRSNFGYARYMEGRTQFQLMTSKWADGVVLDVKHAQGRQATHTICRPPRLSLLSISCLVFLGCLATCEAQGTSIFIDYGDKIEIPPPEERPPPSNIQQSIFLILPDRNYDQYKQEFPPPLPPSPPPSWIPSPSPPQPPAPSPSPRIQKPPPPLPLSPSPPPPSPQQLPSSPPPSPRIQRPPPPLPPSPSPPSPYLSPSSPPPSPQLLPSPPPPAPQFSPPPPAPPPPTPQVSLSLPPSPYLSPPPPPQILSPSAQVPLPTPGTIKLLIASPSPPPTLQVLPPPVQLAPPPFPPPPLPSPPPVQLPPPPFPPPSPHPKQPRTRSHSQVKSLDEVPEAMLSPQADSSQNQTSSNKKDSVPPGMSPEFEAQSQVLQKVAQQLAEQINYDTTSTSPQTESKPPKNQNISPKEKDSDQVSENGKTQSPVLKTDEQVPQPSSESQNEKEQQPALPTTDNLVLFQESTNRLESIPDTIDETSNSQNYSQDSVPLAEDQTEELFQNPSPTPELSNKNLDMAKDQQNANPGKDRKKDKNQKGDSNSIKQRNQQEVPPSSEEDAFNLLSTGDEKQNYNQSENSPVIKYSTNVQSPVLELPKEDYGKNVQLSLNDTALLPIEDPVTQDLPKITSNQVDQNRENKQNKKDIQSLQESIPPVQELDGENVQESKVDQLRDAKLESEQNQDKSNSTLSISDKQTNKAFSENGYASPLPEFKANKEDHKNPRSNPVIIETLVLKPTSDKKVVISSPPQIELVEELNIYITDDNENSTQNQEFAAEGSPTLSPSTVSILTPSSVPTPITMPLLQQPPAPSTELSIMDVENLVDLEEVIFLGPQVEKVYSPTELKQIRENSKQPFSLLKQEDFIEDQSVDSVYKKQSQKLFQVLQKSQKLKQDNHSVRDEIQVFQDLVKISGLEGKLCALGSSATIVAPVNAAAQTLKDLVFYDTSSDMGLLLTNLQKLSQIIQQHVILQPLKQIQDETMLPTWWGNKVMIQWEPLSGIMKVLSNDEQSQVAFVRYLDGYLQYQAGCKVSVVTVENLVHQWEI